MKAIISALSFAIGITLATGLSPQEGAAPPDASGPGDEAIDFTFDNVSLGTVIKLVSEITGRNFLVQTPITGTVLTYVRKKIPASEALEMLEVVLDLNGYTMVESEDPPVIYVVKKASAPERLPAATAARYAGGGAPGEKLIPFTFENVQLATVVRLVAEVSGQNILIQTPISGTVLTYCPKKILASSALDMLRIILDSQGYTMVESENPSLLYVVKKASAPETLPAGPASRPAEDEDSGKEMMSFTFENVQLANIIKIVSERTGKNFLLQTPISGTVLMYCPKLIPASSALDMLRIILDSQGYAMVERESPPIICVVKKAFLASQPTLLGEKPPPTESEGEEPEKVVSPEVPPPPPLQFEVVGATAISGRYAAIIRDRSKRFGRGFHEYILREGDEVPGYFGVRVISITPDPPTVKLLRPGVGVVELRMGQQVEKKPTGWKNVVRPVRKGSTYLVKFKELKQRIPSAEKYCKNLGLEQVTEGGEPKGLRITSLPRDSFLYAAGLKQGDVIETVNGKVIGDEASALELLKTAEKGFNVRVGINRDRTKRTLIYTLLKK